MIYGETVHQRDFLAEMESYPTPASGLQSKTTLSN